MEAAEKSPKEIAEKEEAIFVGASETNKIAKTAKERGAMD